jgi:uncharacterized protein YjiK
MHKVIIGDNSFIINGDERIIKLIISSVSKDIKVVEIKDYEINLIKDNAKQIFDSLSNYTVDQKLSFINEYMKILIEENTKNEQDL